jgi:transposase
MGETRRKLGKDFREGDGALSEDERVELARLRRETPSWRTNDVLKRSVALWVKDAMGP